jgi:hypothetical protein
MFITILFMYSCGIVSFALGIWMDLSNSYVRPDPMRALFVLEFTTARRALPRLVPLCPKR